jgi:hypothetical protein
MLKSFEVHYSFACPNTACLKRNEGRLAVVASDMVNARDQVFERVRCAHCGFNLPTGHHFTTTIKELKA